MLFGRRKPGYTTTVDGSVDPEQAVLELQKAELAAKKKPKAEVFDINAASETARRLKETGSTFDGSAAKTGEDVIAAVERETAELAAKQAAEAAPEAAEAAQPDAAKPELLDFLAGEPEAENDPFADHPTKPAPELPELTRSSVVRADKVRKDLRNALAKGHYPNACMNEAETTLYLDETMYHPAPAAAPVQPKAAQPALNDEELFRRDGADFLNYLKNCQGRLGDQADEELVQMRKTCAAIMGFVHNHPEQLPRVRRYREYYMPTTRKLLNTALGLGESATQNAQEIRRDIVGILHTLNTAYEKLYDTLLQDVSMDVSTEIDTLEAMLNQDGLTHDFAADFGAK